MKCVINLFLHAVSLKNRRGAIVMANTVSRAAGDLTDHVAHSIHCPAIVADDFIDFFSKKIAHRALDQIGFFKQPAWGRIVPNGLIDFGPLVQQNSQIADKIPGALTFANCADDHANPFGNFQLAQDLAQSLAFFRLFNFSRDTAAIAEWHQDQIPPGETEIRGDARTLGADWALGDLHDHVRADRVNARYVFYRDPFSRALVRPSVNFFDAAIERGGNGVPEMKERIFFEADVNKHRLQSHLDVFDFTLVNAAYDVP